MKVRRSAIENGVEMLAQKQILIIVPKDTKSKTCIIKTV
jgi:hypothetical protein